MPEKPGFHGTISLFAILSSIREKTLFTPVCKKKTPSYTKPHFVDNCVNVRRFRQFLEVRPYKEDSSLSCVHFLVFLFLKVNTSISRLLEVRCLDLRNSCLVTGEGRSCESPTCHSSSVTTVTCLWVINGLRSDDRRAAQPLTEGCLSPG